MTQETFCWNGAQSSLLSRKNRAKRPSSRTFAVYLISLIAALSTLFLLAITQVEAEDRPANFVFLVDVSGSMLYKNTMVTAGDGTKIFLFEALRQALKQIVSDPRVLGPNSKACVVTFGTQVTEKSDWPQELNTEEKRQKLVQLIQSPDALQADKHGDTYMGGALAAALEKANKFYAASDPCTTTYVVMLTDGWDEPPRGSTIKVTDSAAKYVLRVKEIQRQLGVKTWQALVIGLQNLPDQKAGTTTAKQLASMLDGQFIDVTKQAGGTVSERIFSSLKQTVESLRGELKFDPRASGSSLKNGVLQFGTVDNKGSATASFPVESRSCYAEEVTGLCEISGSLNDAAKKNLMAKASAGQSSELVGNLPANAITFGLEANRYAIAPQMDEHGQRKAVSEPIIVVAQVHNNCPAGRFVGALQLNASAKMPASIPFEISVPGRLVSSQEKISLLIKKPSGLCWTDPTSGTIENSMKEVAGAHSHAIYKITVTPESADLVTSDRGTRSSAVPRIDAKQINAGKPFSFSLDTNQNERQLMRLDVDIPADQTPGKYRGKLALAVSGNTEIVAPSDLDYEIVVEPSTWEKVAPIAIPVFLLLGVTSLLWAFFWLKTLKR